MLTHLTDILTILITNLYISTGLLGIVLAMAIESCCIPLPSELVMPLAGIMIVSGKLLHGTNSLLALLLVALAGAVGCLLGSIIAYIIGYTGGRPLLLKYGRYLLISQHDADKADQFFQRWGSETTFFSRLLPVVRTYISLPAGIAKMPFAKFCIYTVLGSFPWCLLLAYVGTIIGGNLATLSPIFHTFDVVILIVLVVLIALYIRRHIRNDRKARANLASAEASAMQSPSQPQPQQEWGQQAQPQQEWGQQPQPQNWGQQSQPQQSPGQPLKSQFQPPQPPWMEPQQPSPPRGNDNDRTVRRS
ncbi:MAG TPA: VTT domain-containing protein [Ktedonobacteraceae bacterium]|nr:VTT domain-containing protein [Ktedonobacteraceae bacterium]